MLFIFYLCVNIFIAQLRIWQQWSPSFESQKLKFSCLQESQLKIYSRNIQQVFVVLILNIFLIGSIILWMIHNEGYFDFHNDIFLKMRKSSCFSNQTPWFQDLMKVWQWFYVGILLKVKNIIYFKDYDSIPSISVSTHTSHSRINQ